MSDNDDDKPGYCKPPRKTQFKKGHSGNPNGRPKKPRNLSDMFAAVANSTIEVKVNGKRVRLTRLEAMVMQLAQKALGGDSRAFGQMLRFMKEHGVFAPEEPDGRSGVLMVEAPPLTTQEFMARFCNNGVPTEEQIEEFRKGMNARCDELIESARDREALAEDYQREYGDKFKGFPGNRDRYAMLEAAGIMKKP